MSLKQHLIEGDPAAREGGLDAFHADAMRQRILLEAASQPASAPALWWLRPVAVAGALTACLVIAVVVGLRINTGESTPAYVQPPRQMQFTSPGGTRIIWTFHQEFDL